MRIVVIDLVNARSFEPSDVMAFVTTHEKNLLAAECSAGVGTTSSFPSSAPIARRTTATFERKFLTRN